MKKNYLFYVFVFLSIIFLSSCNTIQINGKTFIYNSVNIDWNEIKNEDKNKILKQLSLNSENEYLKYLEDYQNMKNKIITFGTNNKYIIKDTNNKIIDKGFYNQTSNKITLSNNNNYKYNTNNIKLESNKYGIIFKILLNSKYNIYAYYQYIEKT